MTSLRHPPSMSSRRSRAPVRTLWVELPDYFDVAFRPSAPPGIIAIFGTSNIVLKLERIETSLVTTWIEFAAEEEPPPSYEEALQFLMINGQ